MITTEAAKRLITLFPQPENESTWRYTNIIVAIEAEATAAALALAREQVKQVPLYEDSHLLDYRAAVLAALGGEK